VATQQSVIIRLFEIVDARAWSALPTVFAADVVYDRPGFPQMSGIAQVVRFYGRIRTLNGSHTLVRRLEDERSGCCWGRFEGVKDGRPVLEYFADWYILSGGLISYRRTFFYRPAL
jgi:uncharacterized protein